MNTRDQIDLSIVIVNWNSCDLLKSCIESILRHTRDLAIEIVVIDSASFDGADRMLQECYPHVRFLQSDVNIGFARANNRAFHHSIGETLLFLNPDTEVVGSAIRV